MMTGPKKKLFKLWLELDQIAKLETLDQRDKAGLSWHIRRAVDQYLEREISERKAKKK